MIAMDAGWSLVPVADVDARHWACGEVKDVPDLYRPDIFGPTRNFRCECGARSGEDALDTLCTTCKVWVVADAGKLRRERLAFIELACPCSHPVDPNELVVDCFAVAPIAARTLADGSPDRLGKKYEALIEVNKALRRALPPRDSAEFWMAWRDADRSGLEDALADVVGAGAFRDGDVTALSQDTVFARFVHSLATLSPDTDALARACGLAMKFHGRL